MTHTDNAMMGHLQEMVTGAGDLAEELRSKPYKRITKADGTLVTSVDHAVDRYYHETLGRMFPGDATRSEERPDPPGLGQARRVWLVDPIDGTTLFARGEPEYATLAGLWEDGRIVAGAACFPRLQLTMVAVRGLGVRVNGRVARMSVRGPGEKHKVMTVGKGLRHLKTAGRIVRSPALETLRLIGGEYDGLVTALPPACGEHDYAWAVCAIEELGGIITDGDGRALRFNKPDRGMPPLLVAGIPECHRLLLNALRQDSAKSCKKEDSTE
jgi:myo-inositol-1(or 4)-monophosphatase